MFMEGVWGQVREQGPALVIKNAPGAKGNKKIPPSTVLVSFTGGRVDEPASSEGPRFTWSLQKPTQEVLHQGKVKQLKEVIRDHRIDTIYQHGKFPAGDAPAILAAKKVCTYRPASGEPFEKVFALTSNKAYKMFWSIEVTGSKIIPTGAVFMSAKQLIVKGEEDFVF